MDMVATRAKAGTATVYRRWTPKPELVLDAIARMKRVQVDPAVIEPWIEANRLLTSRAIERG